jgi:hypothetical protein
MAIADKEKAISDQTLLAFLKIVLILRHITLTSNRMNMSKRFSPRKSA